MKSTLSLKTTSENFSLHICVYRNLRSTLSNKPLKVSVFKDFLLLLLFRRGNINNFLCVAKLDGYFFH